MTTHLLTLLNALIVTQEARDHELRAIANSIDGCIFDNEPLVCAKQGLKRLDNLAEKSFITIVIILPLSIKNIMQSDKIAIVLRHDTAANTAQLLHVGTDAQQKTKMDTQSTNVSTGLAGDPENTEVTLVIKLKQAALMDRADAELALDSRNQWGALEQSTGQGLKSLSKSRLAAGNSVMEANAADVFFACTLLGLDETRGTIDADNLSESAGLHKVIKSYRSELTETASDLGIQSTGMTSLVNTGTNYQQKAAN